MRLHLIILHSALANWKAYIGYTRKELDSLVWLVECLKVYF